MNFDTFLANGQKNVYINSNKNKLLSQLFGFSNKAHSGGN